MSEEDLSEGGVRVDFINEEVSGARYVLEEGLEGGGGEQDLVAIRFKERLCGSEYDAVCYFEIDIKRICDTIDSEALRPEE